MYTHNNIITAITAIKVKDTGKTSTQYIFYKFYNFIKIS